MSHLKTCECPLCPCATRVDTRCGTWPVDLTDGPAWMCPDCRTGCLA